MHCDFFFTRKNKSASGRFTCHYNHSFELLSFISILIQKSILNIHSLKVILTEGFYNDFRYYLDVVLRNKPVVFFCIYESLGHSFCV